MPCLPLWATILQSPTPPERLSFSFVIFFMGQSQGPWVCWVSFTAVYSGFFLGGGVITMVGKTNRGWSKMGLGPSSHGSHLFINGPMGTFVFFALGCLDGEGQKTNTLWTCKSADLLAGNENVYVLWRCVLHEYYHTSFGAIHLSF